MTHYWRNDAPSPNCPAFSLVIYDPNFCFAFLADQRRTPWVLITVLIELMVFSSISIICISKPSCKIQMP